MPEDLSAAIKQKARTLGFDPVGITRAEPSLFREEYQEWIDRGYAGEMHYLMRHLERRLDPRQLLPDARSIIVVAMNYYNDRAEGPGTPVTDPDRGIFARYARGDDYHDVMTARLRVLWQWVQTQAGAHAEGRIYVDTGPLLEREVAQKAGLGWFGKNTMLINTRRGSYFLLGEIVTNLMLEPDQPARGGCGTCRRCIDACPTGAIVEPYVLDARRCISYLTIELKGEIPGEYHAAIATSGNRIFGCDICQEVCPFNLRRSVPTEEPAFRAREVTDQPRLTDLLAMDEETFRQKFRGSPVKRARWRGLRRNVLAALQGRTLQPVSEESAPHPAEQGDAGQQTEV
ncbi:MAG: tRNA epoxyqueuosine(34) reductase QueG [Chloroherpetonaceae bacterium]|nr:tRNA epoxyqueuosine(34) reductase QueG [Chthonomonadaceae bacterium]MDW8208388.1 tRNA epoxyqueuosine(34) reductase QueG [Chloroherpetonaceae bacterium]